KRFPVPFGDRFAPPLALRPRRRLDHFGRRCLLTSTVAFGWGRVGGLRLGSARRRALLLAAPPAPRARRAGLRRGEVVGERTCDLMDRAESLACVAEQPVRPRCIALGAREQRGADRDGHLERCLDELRSVVLVAVPT